MKNLPSIIKKYLPDGLVLFGVLIFSYNFLRPANYVCSGLCNPFDNYGGYTDYHTNYKVLGIMLFTLGVVLILRRYFKIKGN
ncbi:MAG: hypothetical protein UT05_C0004G0049 [Parcubacteria group bacterium GW2011_GWF2_38_76]|nr:MAG: hypothetical protein UT05_C0004G0049 [Parcubacteria group bacterium GW2011_GWF2_38_76]